VCSIVTPNGGRRQAVFLRDGRVPRGRPIPVSGPTRQQPELAALVLGFDPGAMELPPLRRGDQPGGHGAHDIGRCLPAGRTGPCQWPGARWRQTQGAGCTPRCPGPAARRRGCRPGGAEPTSTSSSPVTSATLSAGAGRSRAGTDVVADKKRLHWATNTRQHSSSPTERSARRQGRGDVGVTPANVGELDAWARVAMAEAGRLPGSELVVGERRYSAGAVSSPERPALTASWSPPGTGPSPPSTPRRAGSWPAWTTAETNSSVPTTSEPTGTPTVTR
jgi:hypothetical protein